MSSKKAAPAKAPAKAAAKAPAKAAPAKPVRVRKEKKPTQDLTIKTPLGIARGLKRGFPVTKRTRKIRTADVRRIGKRTKFVREVIREVSGYAPYERRIIELMRVGLDKRALKLAKRKIGTHRRALKKREEMGNVVSLQRLAASRAKEDAEEQQ
ncbi:60S ribosomal protein L36, putative [Acanthamoeba castellanii str. Neff]|uniref:60S ribosomal protein L36 n=1 Tax=Acanthamoeba castellanii (strain ATCC 30010 / Neff) TaxID=1257118 RepID=L8GUM9_ACACF|nr:60S ribosomal protein L36, putative [Acanthamoeba castellanii str. Neff]ELR16622.1 60S ribosomal protein L36, putative [Acanthamoeba castellanii str. Neff]